MTQKIYKKLILNDFMKKIFVPTILKKDISNKKIIELSKKIPKNIIIAYSIQFKNIAEKIRKELSKNHNIVSFIQVLGCSRILRKDFDALLLISSGRFHAISLAKETKKEVYLFNGNRLDKITEKEIKEYKANKKTAYLKFLNEKDIGVLVSIKPGQENLRTALKIKEKFSEKNFYFFIGNEINQSEFENFGLKSWINTACPRIDFDRKDILNLRDLNISN